MHRPRPVNWDSADKDWFFIDDGVWYIAKGVAWDGASGVPDGDEDPNKPGYPALWLASLIHDLGYMFMDEDDFPYSRFEIDQAFEYFMLEAGFKYTRVYFLAVRLFGGIWHTLYNAYRCITKQPRQYPTYVGETTEREQDDT